MIAPAPFSSSHNPDHGIARQPVVRLELPLPPSVNGMYANVRGIGRVLTKEARLWKRMASYAILAARVQAGGSLLVPGPVAVSAVLTFPNPRSDLDGPCKALLDILVSERVISDDRHVQELHLHRRQGEPTAVVTVAPFEDPTRSP